MAIAIAINHLYDFSMVFELRGCNRITYPSYLYNLLIYPVEIRFAKTYEVNFTDIHTFKYLKFLKAVFNGVNVKKQILSVKLVLLHPLNDYITIGIGFPGIVQFEQIRC